MATLWLNHARQRNRLGGAVAWARYASRAPRVNKMLTGMIRSPGFTALLLIVGLLALAIHFEIYRRTSASAFVNHPEFYFRNVFIIRDSNGQAMREVSYAIGFSSYFTAFVTVAAIGWGVSGILSRKRHDAA